MVTGLDYKPKAQYFETNAVLNAHLERRESLDIQCKSRCRNHEMRLHGEKGGGNCSISIASRCRKIYLMIHES